MTLEIWQYVYTCNICQVRICRLFLYSTLGGWRFDLYFVLQNWLSSQGRVKPTSLRLLPILACYPPSIHNEETLEVSEKDKNDKCLAQKYIFFVSHGDPSLIFWFLLTHSPNYLWLFCLPGPGKWKQKISEDLGWDMRSA